MIACGKSAPDRIGDPCSVRIITMAASTLSSLQDGGRGGGGGGGGGDPLLQENIPRWFRDTSTWVASFGLVIALSVVVCNALILIAIAYDRRLRDQTSRLVGSLAVADLLLGLTYGINLLFTLKSVRWTLNSTERQLVHLLEFLTESVFYASMFHLLAIGVDRFVSVMAPLMYDRLVTTTVTKVTLCAVWGVSALAGALQELIEVTVKQDEVSTTFVYSLRLSLYVTIAVLMVVIYGRIGCIAAQHRKKIAIQNTGFALDPRPTEPVPRATKILVAVLGCFTLLWLPFYTTLFSTLVMMRTPMDVSAHARKIITIAGQVSPLFGLINSAVNVFIYSLMNREYRHVFLRLFTCKSQTG